MTDIVLLHGWSATSSSMKNLAAFLAANGHATTDLFLGDYVSRDDDVRVADVAKRMDAVLRERVQTNQLDARFDMIVHSTGGLVAREWLVSFAQQWPGGAPLGRLLMLAPANFGSPLAAIGKSMIGRIIKGWDNWFQSGEEMLNALELASAYQWDLARRDLLADEPGQPGPYGLGRVLAFVICGTHGYASGLAQIANEPGCDGTVRPAAANLNTHGLTIDFANGADQPTIIPWHQRLGSEKIAFAVLPDRSHASILDPADMVGSTRGPELGELILAALACAPEAYDALCDDWENRSQATAAQADSAAIVAAFTHDAPRPEDLHQHMQVITRVVDDQGQAVPDYFMEFYAPDSPEEEQDSVDFHRNVMRDVHVNTRDHSLRCLFVDRTGLVTQFYNALRQSVAMSLSAARIGPNVKYFDSTRDGASGHVVVHEANEAAREQIGATRLWHNQTHLVRICIPRQPISSIFEL